ncbi:hypothetical protein LE181_02485 [Streptomyces sp. SCA3-4]|uniref:hypothetical protein n=1 Tax=Streptomyces sichuanensis TaxID=2871810 RepID=UPI001CE24636|nr:hypothetical protein [Streptomyces sichuanensis]MCA6091038.1 hypothetical protein [Streptomyces sichuanensis]
MDKINLPHQGWRRASVPVSHAPDGTATILELQGNVLSSYFVYGLVDTLDRLQQGDMLCTLNNSRQRVRAVVPKAYTHVKLRAPSGGGGGLLRWKLGFRPSTTCAELSDAAHGKHPDVLQYRGPAVKARFEVHKGGYAYLHHRSSDGGKQQLEYVSLGPYRGTVEIPGPGLIEVDCLTAWSLTLTPLQG